MSIRFPNESDAYRAARDDLLKAEAELRALTERVATQRRALPAGGEVKEDYVFDGEDGPVQLSELFGEQDTLFLYGFMYGPAAKNPCPLCTSIMDAFDANARNVREKVAFVGVMRSPIDRTLALAETRGWETMRFVSSSNNSYHRDYFAETEEGNQMPMANVFVKRDGKILHSWGSELLYFDSPDGMDARHMDPMWPLWNILDATPGGRGDDFYPSL